MPETTSEREKRPEKIQKGVRSNKKDVEEMDEEAETEGPPVKRLKFRNYVPHDKSLATRNKSAIKNTSNSSDQNDVDKKELDPIKKHLQKAEDLKEGERDLAFKKPHFDLKAQIESKMLKLRKRTTRAIVSLLREKFAAEGES